MLRVAARQEGQSEVFPWHYPPSTRKEIFPLACTAQPFRRFWNASAKGGLAPCAVMAGRLDRLYTLATTTGHLAAVRHFRVVRHGKIEHWQVRREGGQRGIVEIVPEGT